VGYQRCLQQRPLGDSSRVIVKIFDPHLCAVGRIPLLKHHASFNIIILRASYQAFQACVGCVLCITFASFSSSYLLQHIRYTTNAFAPADLDRLSYTARDHYQLGSLGDPVLINGDLVYGYDPTAGGVAQVYPPGFDRPGFYASDRPQRRRTTASALPHEEGVVAEVALVKAAALEYPLVDANEQKSDRKASSRLRGSSENSASSTGEVYYADTIARDRQLGWMQDDELEEHLIDGSGQAPGHRTVIVSWAACAWGFGAVDDVQDPLRVSKKVTIVGCAEKPIQDCLRICTLTAYAS